MRRSDQRRDAVFALYQQDVTNRPLSALLVDAKPFTIELAEGTDQHVGEIDEVISEFAKGWDINRIAPLEKNIMRVALYEMNYRDDIPREVAIDEAVETAKNYSGTDAPGFVHGILGAAAREMEADAPWVRRPAPADWKKSATAWSRSPPDCATRTSPMPTPASSLPRRPS